MRPNYEIKKTEYFKKPLFISVYNWQAINLIGLFNYITSQKKEYCAIGQWIIKYKI